MVVPNLGCCAVVVPCFNTAKYLDACLQSIRDQTYQNLRIYVVNDSSTDQTQDVIDFHARNDVRVIPLRTNRQSGVSRARNLALEHIYQSSDISFVGFIDSDDFIAKDFFLCCVNKLSDNLSLDFVEVGVVYFDKIQGPERYLDKEGCVEFYGKYAIIKHYLSRFVPEYENKTIRHSTSLGLSNKLFRFSSLRKQYFRRDLKCLEDQQFFLDIAANFDSAAVMRNDLYFYRQRKSSLSHSANNVHLMELELYLRILNACDDFQIRLILSKAVLRIWWRLLGSLLFRRDWFFLSRNITAKVFAQAEETAITLKDRRRKLIASYKPSLYVAKKLTLRKRMKKERRCEDYFD